MFRQLDNAIRVTYDELVSPMTFYHQRRQQLQRNPMIPLRFFTIWALILHSLHYIGILPFNTFAIGLFVFIGSLFIFWIFPGYYPFLYRLRESAEQQEYSEMAQNKYRYITLLALLDIATHYLPLFLMTAIPVDITQWLESIAVLTVSLCIYFATQGADSVWRIYYYALNPTHIDYLVQK